MNKVIQAIVIDGFHKGHVVRMSYFPTIRLLKPQTIEIDTCCDLYEYPPSVSESIEYKACFQAVDQEVVLYSTTGKSEDVFKWFAIAVSDKPWRDDTSLYYGLHGGYMRREDGTGADEEYQRGFRKGVERGYKQRMDDAMYFTRRTDAESR